MLHLNLKNMLGFLAQDTCKKVVIEREVFVYHHIKSRRMRRLSVTIHKNKEIVVRSPDFISVSDIESFLKQKSDWIRKALKKIDESVPGVVHSKEEVMEYKNKARGILLERLPFYNRQYNFSWKKVTVKIMKTRWGSCSSKGNLNFNYKIALLPSSLADYIIVHELCHLKEMNHGERFWSLVEKQMPQYKQLRKELKKYQL